MKRRLKHFALWLTWGLCVFLGAIYIHFPKQEIVEGLPYLVESASEGEWALDVGDAGLYWLNGAEIRDATLYSIEKPEPAKKKKKRRKKSTNTEPSSSPNMTTPVAGTNGTASTTGNGTSLAAAAKQPTMLKPFLHIDRARASVSPMSLVFGETLDIDFEADLHGGHLEGSYERGAEHYAVNWESSAIDVTGLPMDIPGMFDLTGRGAMVTKGNMKRHVGQVKKDTGDFSFDFPNLFADKLTFQFAGGIDAYVEDATFSKATLAGSIQSGKLTLTEGALLSDKVELSFSGEMNMNNKDMDTWKVRFEMTMNPLDPDLVYMLNIGSGLKKALGDDGIYYFLCEGQWAQMACTPNHSIVGGSTKTPTTSKSTPASRSSRRTPPKVSAAAERINNASEKSSPAKSSSDAEARRQERLERIRKRREEERDVPEPMDIDYEPEFDDRGPDGDFREIRDLPPMGPEEEFYGDEEFFDEYLPEEGSDDELPD